MSGRKSRASNRGSQNRSRQRSVSPETNQQTMASRSKRPRRVLENIPKNWTVQKLCQEISVLGLDLPTSTPHKSLLTAYEQLINKQVASNENQNGDTGEISDMPEVIVDAHRLSAHVPVPARMDVNKQNEQLMFEIGSLQATVAELSRKVNTNSSSEAGQSFPNHSLSLDLPSIAMPVRKTMDELPDTTAVSEANRKLILAKKHVNLASLLIPGVENTGDQTRIIDNQGNHVIIKSNDPRMMRNLTIDEFRTAFTKYIQVACDKDEPQGDTGRLAEFVKYMDYISSLSTQFGGSYFYDYHNMFSKKAEQLEAKGHPVDWAGMDTKTYLKIFSGLRSNLCAHCNSATHESKLCHLSANTSSAMNQPHEWSTFSNNTWSPSQQLPYNQMNQGSRQYHIQQFGQNSHNHSFPPSQPMPFQQGGQVPFQGAKPSRRDLRPRKHFNGKEICINFNTIGCSLDHGGFHKVVHVCERCFSPTHSVLRCTKPPQ